MTSNENTVARRLRARLTDQAIKTGEDALLAARLHHYAEAEGMDWDRLAASLECSVNALNAIALCRPPRPDTFAEDVEAIAGNYVSIERLFPLLRRLEVLDQLRAARYVANTGTHEQALLAARDRDDANITSSINRPIAPEAGVTNEDRKGDA